MIRVVQSHQLRKSFQSSICSPTDGFYLCKGVSLRFLENMIQKVMQVIKTTKVLLTHQKNNDFYLTNNKTYCCFLCFEIKTLLHVLLEKIKFFNSHEKKCQNLFAKLKSLLKVFPTWPHELSFLNNHNHSFFDLTYTFWLMYVLPLFWLQKHN